VEIILLILMCTPVANAEIQSMQGEAAPEWWELEPYTQWSAKEVGIMLGSSPWVRLSSMFLLRGSAKTNMAITKDWTGTDFSAVYQVRLITAMPVREAVLRSISLYPRSVGLDEIGKRNPEKEKARLENFVISNPNHFIVKGDEEHIIASVRLIYAYELDKQMSGGIANRKLPGFDELSEVDLPRIMANTFLETDSGKRMKISRYMPPGRDGLGAKLIFKRKLPDGTPFITETDKDLRLELRLKYHKVKVKFDLSKMMYRGKLEY
jgi:hypothetical protein